MFTLEDGRLSLLYIRENEATPQRRQCVNQWVRRGRRTFVNAGVMIRSPSSRFTRVVSRNFLSWIVKVLTQRSQMRANLDSNVSRRFRTIWDDEDDEEDVLGADDAGRNWRRGAKATPSHPSQVEYEEKCCTRMSSYRSQDCNREIPFPGVVLTVAHSW